MRKMMIEGFITFCYAITIINDFFTNLYNKFEPFKMLCDNVYIPLEYFYYTITFQQLEPKAVYWCSHSWITYNDTALTTHYNLTERIQIMDESYNLSMLLFIYEAFTGFLSLCSNPDASYNNKLDPLFIIKNISDDDQPFYIVYQMYLPPEDYVYAPSNVRFLSISYNHPDMDKSIELKLGPQWLIKRNQLFTPTFVLRALQYQSQSYVFDDLYNIKVIDSNVNMFEFGINKYMVITEDSYELIDASNDSMKRDADTNEIDEDTNEIELDEIETDEIDEDTNEIEEDLQDESSVDSVEVEGTIVE